MLLRLQRCLGLRLGELGFKLFYALFEALGVGQGRISAPVSRGSCGLWRRTTFLLFGIHDSVKTPACVGSETVLAHGGRGRQRRQDRQDRRARELTVCRHRHHSLPDTDYRWAARRHI